jgi:SNF2 family DNA or RNA helicase
MHSLIRCRGLGKTLQTIALVWTLLSRSRRRHLTACERQISPVAEQNPYGGTSAGGVIGKALIVCPVTLVNVGGSALLCVGVLVDLPFQNWKNEFKKW